MEPGNRQWRVRVRYRAAHPPGDWGPEEIEQLIARIRERCAPHRGGVRGFCAICFRAALEEVVHTAKHPEMKRDVVDARILAAVDPQNERSHRSVSDL